MVTNLASGVQAFTSNAFLVSGSRRVLVDTGANFDVVSRIDSQGGVDAVVITHTHPDHVGNLATVKDTYDVESWGFDTDREGIDHEIEDGELVEIGDHEYRAIHTPGHKNDHLCFYSPESGVLFAGDLIFANAGFGRTDLEEGDRSKLIESIESVLEMVDDDLEVMHTGHGPSVPDPRNNIERALQAARTR